MNDFDLSAILQKPEFGAMLLKGIEMTMVVAAASWLMAMALALLLLTIRLTTHPLAERFVAAYVSYHRNVPTLVQLMLWYFGIGNLMPADFQSWLSEHHGEAIFAIVALGLCQAAYFSEDLRSGMRSIPAGQSEAARALGHSYFGSMRRVILPQAVRNAVPALVNHTVSLFKNSSLAMAIGVAELTYTVREIESQSFRTFESYLLATVLYLGFSLMLMGMGAWVGKRFSIVTAR
jgi:polar amino acid transport system permease protein